MEKKQNKTEYKQTCKGCYMYTICDIRKGGYAPDLRTCYIEVKH